MGFRWPKRRRVIRKRHRKYAHRWAERVFGELEGIPSDPVLLKRWAVNKIEDHGYRLVIRPDLTAHANRFTMTLRKQIRLVATWDDLPVWKQALILVHEFIHVLQRKALGNTRFELRYLSAPWRWAIETPAYLATMLAYKALGKSQRWLRSWIPGKLDRLYDGYKLGRIRRGDFQIQTRRVWGMAL